MIDWERTCIMGVGRSTLKHNGDVRCPRGHTPFFPCDERWRHGLHLGKNGATWEHVQVVDLSSLHIIGEPERLDHPISTPMEIHDYRHKKEHEENEAREKNRRVGKKYVIIDGKRAHLATLGPQWDIMVWLSVTICEGAQHTQKTWSFSQVTVGVPIRETTHNQRKTRKKWRRNHAPAYPWLLIRLWWKLTITNTSREYPLNKITRKIRGYCYSNPIIGKIPKEGHAYVN